MGCDDMEPVGWGLEDWRFVAGAWTAVAMARETLPGSLVAPENENTSPLLVFVVVAGVDVLVVAPAGSQKGNEEESADMSFVGVVTVVEGNRCAEATAEELGNRLLLPVNNLAEECWEDSPMVPVPRLRMTEVRLAWDSKGSQV